MLHCCARGFVWSPEYVCTADLLIALFNAPCRRLHTPEVSIQGISCFNALLWLYDNCVHSKVHSKPFLGHSYAHSLPGFAWEAGDQRYLLTTSAKQALRQALHQDAILRADVASIATWSVVTAKLHMCSTLAHYMQHHVATIEIVSQPHQLAAIASTPCWHGVDGSHPPKSLAGSSPGEGSTVK